MKFVAWTLAILLAVAISIVGLQFLASERVEVVELRTSDENGEAVTTRLWIVDDEGYQYLRVGTDGSGWFSRIEANESFQITRNGNTAIYSAVRRPEKSARINQLMQEKYTWGDTLIGYLVGSREGSIPIELHNMNQALDPLKARSADFRR
ncbi:MAG: hypothetical protein R3F41_12835 [Gammaproteobacteria bacterium]|nr:hypothetical protein [Pseudomonadales bacterium]MCP5348983.1 hypothetical protein [Pseudomonadales bacterium]